jgi:hypothetical protein
MILMSHWCDIKKGTNKMALVSVGYTLSVDLRDTSNTSTILRYELTSPDFSTAQTDATAILTALQTITTSVVYTYTLCERYAEDAFNLPANAENAIKAEVTGRLSGTGAGTASFRVPSPVDAIFVGSTGSAYNVVDIANTDLIAYATIFETGQQATISDGQTFAAPVGTALNGGRRISRRSRNP